MGRLFFCISLLVAVWSTRVIGMSVFYSGPQANAVLRAKRANSFMEELRAPSQERECVEEVCTFEEACEIFHTREATLEFWTVYTDGNQCEKNPCVNGTCVDQFQSYVCKCDLGFEGRNCDRNSTASNCTVDNGDCDHVCREREDGGGRSCSCLSGYRLQDDSKTCRPSGEYSCGQLAAPRVADKPILGLQPWLVGGEVGKKGESPWQVLILNDRGKFHCGGVLIDQSWVLTAAHCLETSNRFSVRLGDYERFKFEGTELTVAVDKAVSHPDYNTETVDNDIALLRLKDAAHYSPFIVPACLPDRGLAEGVLHRNGTRTVVTGWGKQDELKKHFTSALSFINIPLLDHDQCAGSMENNVSRNMLCAGVLGRREDACDGDSGGPMVTRYRDTWFLIGLVSWGEGCGWRDKVGIYTKVSNYMEWIDSVRNTHAPTPPSP
ncbi:vitamin K-dependent protein C [Conger conger]|uniref:vitamin K-dependent protein C n=1 Tax=Conger conger TaxID=82655 RepID=UPI002A5994E2|nr:vitamin K-dependent protein C [Conger conger]